ncbi:MAG TPA: T9SS type A sorting domain-containing protein, partial [Saprospiraceae bacterium]|nr:T9SS type A sorting domain-containing protein [Saprospiraceae bacterium]
LLVDEDHHVFANISTERPDESYRGGGMIALDANGRFNGMMMMNNPNAEATFAPFGQGRYISQYRGSSVFDAQGNLIASGRGIGGNHFARVTTTNGHVYFSKPIDHFKFSYMTIGKISYDFEIDEDSISLQSLAIEGFGICNRYQKPARTSQGVWIVPFGVGPVDVGMSTEHSFVCAIKDEKILWKFPQLLTDHSAIALTAEGERIGVVLSAYRQTNQFFLLDNNGQVQTQFDFQVTERVEDVRMNQEHVAILTNNSLYVYTMDGVQVSHTLLTNDFLINPTEFEVIGNGQYIIAGNYQGQATIIRISMPNPVSPSRPDDQVDLYQGNQSRDNQQETTPVSQVTLQTLSAETISASVFPNPASLYINFELKNRPAFPCTIAVFDGSGQQLHQDTFEGNNYTLPLDRFVPGTYYYRLQFSSSQEKILSGKFVKI